MHSSPGGSNLSGWRAGFRRVSAQLISTGLSGHRSGNFYHMDFKSQLQERLQALHSPQPSIRLLAPAVRPQKQFSVELKINGRNCRKGA
jgi:dsRNA-specific ribonuclease